VNLHQAERIFVLRNEDTKSHRLLLTTVHYARSSGRGRRLLGAPWARCSTKVPSAIPSKVPVYAVWDPYGNGKSNAMWYGVRKRVV
jgi:hypothetical protein